MKVLRLLTVSLVAAGVIGIVLLLLLVIFSGHGTAGDVCRTPGCNKYARLLSDALNVSVQPCESFTQFVCDGWQHHKEHGVPELVVTEAIETMTRLVNVTYLPKTGQDSAQRGLALYRSCDALLQGQRDELPGVREALREVGITWPLRATHIDVPHVILATSLRLGWDVMFRVVPLWQSPRQTSTTLLLNSGRTILEILNKTSSRTALLKRRSYFDVLYQQLEHSHREINGSWLDEVSFEEVSDLEKSVVATLRRAYYRPEVLPPVPVQGIMDVPSLGLSRARWEETLLRFGLRDRIPPGGFEFRTANDDYVKTFIRLWEQLGNARMHLFVSWCTVQVGALLGNQELIASFYGGDLNTAKTQHAAFCFSRAFAVSGPYLFARYNQQAQTSSTLQDARRLALSMRSFFHKRLLHWSGYDGNVTVISNWTSLDTLFGLIHGGDRAINVRRARQDRGGRGSGDFDRMFPDLDEHGLLSNLRRTSSLFAVSSGEYDESIDVEVTAVLSSLTMLMFSATFYGRPDFQLMPYATAFPFFDFELIPGVNFGGFGAEVAKAIGVLTLKAYRLSGPLKSDGLIRNCFRSSPFAKDTNLFLALAEALALGALVDAYEESARGDERYRMRLPGFAHYTGTQLLFIAFCFPKCRGRAAGDTPASTCNLPLMYLPEFSRAFECAAGTPMNPTEKCDLI